MPIMLQHRLPLVPGDWRSQQLFDLCSHYLGLGSTGEVCDVHEFTLYCVRSISAMWTFDGRCYISVVNVALGVSFECSSGRSGRDRTGYGPAESFPPSQRAAHGQECILSLGLLTPNDPKSRHARLQYAPRGYYLSGNCSRGSQSGVPLEFGVYHSPSNHLWIAFLLWERRVTLLSECIEPVFPWRFLRNRVWMGMLL